MWLLLRERRSRFPLRSFVSSQSVFHRRRGTRGVSVPVRVHDTTLPSLRVPVDYVLRAFSMRLRFFLRAFAISRWRRPTLLRFLRPVRTCRSTRKRPRQRSYASCSYACEWVVVQAQDSDRKTVLHNTPTCTPHYCTAKVNGWRPIAHSKISIHTCGDDDTAAEAACQRNN